MGQEYISFLFTKNINNITIKIILQRSHKTRQDNTCFYYINVGYLKGATQKL